MVSVDVTQHSTNHQHTHILCIEYLCFKRGEEEGSGRGGGGGSSCLDDLNSRCGLRYLCVEYLCFKGGRGLGLEGRWGAKLFD